MGKKGKKKDKHDIETIVLVTALINLIKRVRERNKISLPYLKNTL